VAVGCLRRTWDTSSAVDVLGVHESANEETDREAHEHEADIS